MAEVEVRAVFSAVDTNLASTIDAVNSKLNQLTSTQGVQNQAMRAMGVSANAAQANMLALATAEARLLVQSRQLSEAESVLATALGNVAQRTPQAINAQRQLLQIQQQLAGQSTTLSSKFSELTQRLGQLGELYLAQRAVKFAADLIQTGNEMEKVTAKVKALSGSQKRFDEVTQLARQNTQLYGGSLKDNLDSLGQFVNLANRTGVSLQELENVARRLAIVDPVQGFSGAAVALKEFFSGDTRSLSRRFEINPSLLRDINKLGDDGAKLKALDEVLNKLGFTQQVLTNQANTTAASYDRLATAVENVKVKAGQDLAKILEPQAKGLTSALTAGDQFTNVNASIVQNASSFEDYAKRTAAAAGKVEEGFRAASRQTSMWSPTLAAISELIFRSQGSITQLSAAQYEYAKALISTGTNSVTAFEQAQKLITQQTGQAEFIKNVSEAIRDQKFAYSESQQAQLQYQLSAAQLPGVFQQIQTAGPQFAAALNAINVQMENNVFSPLQYAAALHQLQNAAKNASVDVDQAAESTRVYTAVTNQAISKQIEDANAKQIAGQATTELTQFQTDLANIADAVSRGLVSNAGAAELLRAKYLDAAEGAEALIAQQARIVAGEARIASQKKNTTTLAGPDIVFNTPGRTGTSDVNKAIEGQRAAKEAAEAAARAQKEYEKTVADSQTKVKLLKSELSGLTVGSEAYYNKLAEIHQAEEQANKKRLKGARSTDDAVTKSRKAAGDKQIESERKTAEKIAKIREDYAKKLAAQQRANEISKRTTRADFYADLIDAPAGTNTAAMSAAFEKAFQEAQQIAAEGNAKLADDYLQLRTRQIQELQELEDKKRAVEEDDSLSAEEKKRKIEQIEGVKKLKEEAHAEEVRQLKEQGDELNNELEEKLAAEEERYVANSDKIIEQANRTAEARIAAWQRANEIIANDPGPEFTGDVNAPQIPETDVKRTQPPTETRSTTNTNIQPVTIDPTKTLFVFDEKVATQLGNVTAALELGFNRVVGAIETNTRTLGSKLDEVNSSVRRIKSVSTISG